MRRALLALAATLGLAACADDGVSPELRDADGCPRTPFSLAPTGEPSPSRIARDEICPRTIVTIPAFADNPFPAAAWDLNDQGEVLGADGQNNQLVWSKSGSRRLTLPGSESTPRAVALNNRGDVLGFHSVYVGDNRVSYRVLIWNRQGAATDLGSLGAQDALPRAINDQGAIAGQLRFNSGAGGMDSTRAFLRSADGRVHVIPTPGTQADARQVNSRGQVVGYFVDGGVARGFVWSEQDGLRVLPVLNVDPNMPNNVLPSAINDAGWVVGSVGSASSRWYRGFTHAFVWTPEGGMRDLGTLGGRGSGASDINAHGEVVGRSDVGDRTLGFTWHQSYGIVGVEAPDAPGYGVPSSINNSGDLVGSIWENNQWRHVVWTRRPEMYQ